MFELSLLVGSFTFYFFILWVCFYACANVLCDVGVGREGEDSNFVVFSVFVPFFFRAIFFFIFFGGENASVIMLICSKILCSVSQ